MGPRLKHNLRHNLRHSPDCPFALLNSPHWAVTLNMAFAAINSAGVPIAAIEEAFATEPSLKKRVYDAIGELPTVHLHQMRSDNPVDIH